MSTVNVKCEEGSGISNHATDGNTPSENVAGNTNETNASKNKETDVNKNDTDKKEAAKNGPDSTPKPVSRPPYIPPHLMGRDLNDPAQDMIGTGRRVQKPRLGVKVPYRNLTSQIVSQDEIAQEILERSLRKYSYSEVPEGGDVFFAMKLTHRLANKITPANEASTDKTPDAGIVKKVETIENAVSVEKPTSTPVKRTVEKSKPVERKNDSPVVTKPTVVEKPQEVEEQPKVTNPDTSNANETCKNDTSANFESKATDQLFAEISSTLGEECKISKAVKLSPNSNACPKNSKILNGSISQAPETELDNDTLLAILEGTSDVSDVSINAVSTPKIEVKQRKKRIKPLLDPSVEKELALKQLMDFETKKNEDRLKKTVRRKPDEETPTNQQVNTTINSSIDSSAVADVSQDTSKPTEASKTEPTPKKIRKSPFNSGTTAPKRFPKKYQRIIKRQLRSSKLKVKTASPDQQKKLPEVPEVQIAIDRYIKTYASKRKLRPEPEEKPIEKKLKEATPAPSEQPTEEIRPEIVVESDENRKDSTATVDEEIKENESPSNAKPKANSKVMREINRLLGDEGAINMIYSIEQKRLPDSKRDANILPSLRRKKRDLLLKTKLVKNAVLRLSMSPGQLSPGRVRRTSPEISQSKSTTSPSRKTSIESVDSTVSEPSPKVRKVAAEASRIIRRHSSSSAYSSDEEETEKKIEKTIPQTPTTTEPTEKKSSSGMETRSKTTEAVVETNNNESPIKEVKNHEKEAPERRESAASAQSSASKRKDSKDEAEVKNQNDASSASSYSELVEQLSLKEITVRRYDNLVQIILISSSGKMKNAVNIQVFNELTNVLRELQKDENCRTVLVTSTGSSFCQGIDLQALICSDKTERRKIVNEYVTALLNFTKSLSQFRKVLIAGVHGSAVGLGVTMLPFFDMVFASDKATFYTPYVKLGQIPEAGATLTLPHLLGNAVTSELLFGCRMLTASEALQFGLVTRILWPDKFSEELLPIARGVAGHSSQSMEATKSLLRQAMNEKLEEQLNTEAKLLREHWCSDECQKRFKEYLQQEALLKNK